MQNYQCRGKSYQPSRTKTESNNCFIGKNLKRKKTKKMKCHNMKLTENMEKIFTVLICCHANEYRIL